MLVVGAQGMQVLWEWRRRRGGGGGAAGGGLPNVRVRVLATGSLYLVGGVLDAVNWSDDSA
jgi:hypothetical protein